MGPVQEEQHAHYGPDEKTTMGKTMAVKEDIILLAGCSFHLHQCCIRTCIFVLDIADPYVHVLQIRNEVK